MTLEIRPESITIGGVEIDHTGISMQGVGYSNSDLISFYCPGGIIGFNELEIQVLKRMIPLFFDESLFDVLEKVIGDKAAFEASVKG